MNDLRWGDLDAAAWGLAVLGMLFGFIWLAWWRRHRLEALAARGPLPGQLDAQGAGRLLLRAFLVLCAAALLVVGLMRPQHGTRATELKNLGIDVAVALDASKSMKVADTVPDRLQAATLEIHRLLDSLHGGRVALVPFAGLAFVQTPLTSDFDVVKTYLGDLRVEDMPRGGTAIGRAIIEGIRVLIPPGELKGTPAEASGDAQLDDVPDEAHHGSKHKALVLFTDGEDHEGDPLAAAELAKRHGIRIFAIGVGTAQGRPVPLVNEEGQVTGVMKGADGRTPLFSELGEKLLREIAQTTDGEYFTLGPAGLGEGLVAALDRLEKAEYEATFQQLGDDRYQLAVLPALLLLAIEAWLSGRRRRRRRAS